MKIGIVVGKNDIVNLEEIKKTIAEKMKIENIDIDIEIINEESIQAVETLVHEDFSNLISFKSKVVSDHEKDYAEWKKDFKDNFNTIFKKKGVLKLNKVLEKDSKGKSVNKKRRCW